MSESHYEGASDVEAAKKSLESYIFHIKQTVDTCGDKLNFREKNIIEAECENCLKWLATTSNPDIEEVVNHQKHLQLVCGPYLAKLFGPEGSIVPCRLEARRDEDEDPNGTGGSGYSGKGTPGSFLEAVE